MAFWRRCSIVLGLLLGLLAAGPGYLLAQHGEEPAAAGEHAGGGAEPAAGAAGEAPHDSGHEGGGILDSISGYPFFFKPVLVVVHMVAFLLFFLILKTLLFDRLFGFMTDRQSQIDSSLAAIREEQKKVAALQAQYDAAVAAADKQAYEKLQQIVRDAVTAKSEAVARAHADALEGAEAARESVAEEKGAALAALRTQVDAIAAQVLKTVGAEG